jgi:hypothetical protein
MAFPADVYHLLLSSLPAMHLVLTLPNLPISCHVILKNPACKKNMLLSLSECYSDG